MAVTTTDRRTDTTNRHPVWTSVFSQLSWASGETAAVNTTASGINGQIKQIICTPTEATAGGTTFQIDLYDNNDVLVNQVVAALDDAAGATLYTESDFSSAAFVNGFYLKVTPNQDPSTNGTTMDITARGI